MLNSGPAAAACLEPPRAGLARRAAAVRLLRLLLLDQGGDLAVLLGQRVLLGLHLLGVLVHGGLLGRHGLLRLTLLGLQLRLLGVQRVLGRVEVGHGQVDVALGDLVVLVAAPTVFWLPLKIGLSLAAEPSET